jgi:hypothetical protein
MNATLAGAALLGSLAVILGAPDTARAVQVPGGADSVKVRAAAEPAVAHPGGEVSIAVVLEHAAGFHSWPHEPVVPPEFAAVNPIATTIEVTSLPEGDSSATPMLKSESATSPAMRGSAILPEP